MWNTLRFWPDMTFQLNPLRIEPMECLPCRLGSMRVVLKDGSVCMAWLTAMNTGQLTLAFTSAVEIPSQMALSSYSIYDRGLFW